MFKTFLEIKNSSVLNISGVDARSDQFKRFVNEATERLLSRGDWAGTVVPVKLCVRKGCLVFPRWVGSVRKMNVCKQPIEIRNNWFEFFEKSDWPHYAGQDCRVTGPTPSPVFQDILGDGRALRIYTDYAADVGKSITIFGVDNNGQPLRTQNSDGTWSEGMKLTLSVPWTDSTTTIRKITRIVKDVTQGNVRIFAGHPNIIPPNSFYTTVDNIYWIDGLSVGQSYTIIAGGNENNQQFPQPHDTYFYNTYAGDTSFHGTQIMVKYKTPFTFTATDTRLLWKSNNDPLGNPVPVLTRVYDGFPLEEVVTLEPSQVNPEFQRYQLNIPGCGDCSKVQSVIALVKVKFVPVDGDNDLVLINNTAALKFMVQAIQLEESNDDEAAAAKEQKAIRELNLQLQDRQPDDQVPVDLGETAGTAIGFQQCF